MTTRPLHIAIVYPGDSEIRRLATRENNRFAAVFAAFAAHGVDARPAVYNLAQTNELREQLLEVDGALIWVNPIDAGLSRAPLDALLREVADAGVIVSTHPDVIMKLGTKDVLIETREMGWGSDVHRLDTLEQLRAELGDRLDCGSIRVLKQWRGHSGIGVWRVQRAPGEAAFGAGGRVLAKHAPRGSPELTISFDEFVALMAPYFEDGGHMIDQAWQPRLTEGMVRCYLVQDRVTGFGLQAVNALHPPLAGDGSGEAPTPSQRLYHPADLLHLQGLKHRLEREWVPQLERTLGIRRDELPLLWDCDFLHGEPAREGEERYVLCEINVSSVAPFPDSAIEPLVLAALSRIERKRRPP
ncbi:MAG: Cj0069 family protein [Pseudomonadota bacterium]|nr:Cj0069 family protein [Pseudomonadota bacterium]